MDYNLFINTGHVNVYSHDDMNRFRLHLDELLQNHNIDKVETVSISSYDSNCIIPTVSITYNGENTLTPFGYHILNYVSSNIPFITFLILCT